MKALTEVELYWLEGRIERWIRFGRDVEERIIDRRRRVLSFAPGTVFAFVDGHRTTTEPWSRASTFCAPSNVARPARRSRA